MTRTNLSTSGASDCFIERITSLRLSGCDWTNTCNVFSSGACIVSNVTQLPSTLTNETVAAVMQLQLDHRLISMQLPCNHPFDARKSFVSCTASNHRCTSLMTTPLHVQVKYIVFKFGETGCFNINGAELKYDFACTRKGIHLFYHESW